MEHHKTKNIMHAKRSLDYKHLLSTEFYVHLAEELFSKSGGQKFITRCAVNIKRMPHISRSGL